MAPDSDIPNSSVKILVTGGGGFIGSHSVEALLESGADVTVFDNFSTGKRDNLPSHRRLAIVDGDIRDAAALRSAVAGMSHVLHLAASVSVAGSIEDPAASCEQNVGGFVNMLDAARRARVGRVVYASSAAIYGMPSELPLTEDSPAAPISPYGLEKYIDDQYARLFGEVYGLSSLGMRYFNVYGPRQDASSPYAGVISKFAHRLARGEPVQVFGDGLQTRDFVFVRDVGDCNVQALRSDYTGVCNVGTGTSVTLLELVELLACIDGKQAEVRYEPAQAGDIRHSAMSTARLQKVFGAVPATRLADGLKALWKSYQPPT